MDILRLTMVWTGFTGAPGYSNFHFAGTPGFWDGGLLGDQAQAAADAANDQLSSGINFLRSVLPTCVQVSIENEAEVLNSDTGEILGAIEVDGGGGTGSGGTSGWSAASGAVVNWRTNDYRFGRRIRGRTFVVPIAGEAYEDDGTLEEDARSTLRDFAGQLVGGSGDVDFGVWSRPRDGSGGVFATAVGYSVPDLAAVLRSRRD